MVDPVAVSTSLSIFSSLMSIAASVKQTISTGLSSEQAIERYLSEASLAERNLLSDPDVKMAISELTTISDRLLKQLEHEALECEDNHIQSRRDAKHQIDKDQADVDASGCMCSVLRTLIRHNGRTLPSHGPFEGWWTQYSCKL